MLQIFEMPPITRILIVISVLLSYATYSKLLSPTTMYLSKKLAFGDQFQPWRIITSMLYLGDIDLMIFFRLFFLHVISSSLENHTFSGSTANYLYYILLNVISLTTVGLIFQEHSLAEPFIISMMYLWSRYNQDRHFLVMFVIPIRAHYMTWFFIFMNIIQGRSIRANIIGVFVGHTYYYLTAILPKLPHFKDITILSTPKFMVRLFDKQRV